MKLLAALALIFMLLPAAHAAGNQGTSRPPGAMSLSSRHMAKGGIGIVNTHLYIDLKSATNELVLSDGHRWANLSREKPEVVVFFQDRIWPSDDLPREFDLSKAIIISFERDVVRFFEFEKSSGGYYQRQ